MVKVYRKLEPGINPEIEVGRFLTEVAGFANTPALLGSVELVEGDNRRQSAVAVVHAFVENQGDGWTVTAAYLDRFVDEQRLLAKSEHPGESEEQVPYLRYMSQTGRRVAEMHLALASRDDIAGFRAGADQARRRQEPGSTRSRAAPNACSTRSSSGAKACEKPIGSWSTGCWPNAPRLRDRLSALLPPDIDGLNIRHHGDFHLGQMLIVKDDIFIIDFEGEPRRPHRRTATQGAGRARRRRADPFDRLFGHRGAGARGEGSARRTGQAWHGACGMARRAAAAFLAAYRETMTDPRLWPADPHAARRMLDFFLLEKAFYEIEYELAYRPDWLRVPLTGALRILSEHSKRGPMTKLSAEAYAIVEGRHSDPFRYLGLHAEGDQHVVRAFLPEASKVEADRRARRSGAAARIHDAGLFAGAMPNGSQRYLLRARFGDNVVDLDDPYRFPPVLSDFDLYLLGEGTHQRIYDKLGAHPMTLDGVGGVAFVVLAPNARRVSVVGDFNFWNARRHPMRVRGDRLLGIVRAPRQRGRPLQIRYHRPQGQHLPLKSDPMAFAAEVRPEHRLHRFR